MIHRLPAQVFIIILVILTNSVLAAQSYTPSQVFAGVEYANKILDKVLANKNIGQLQLPQSREKSAKPMHVYELHISVLKEIYHYTLHNNLRPPPLAVSTPIKYSPTDVFYLTQLVIGKTEEIYRAQGSEIDFEKNTYSGKTPSNVYQEIFSLFYRLNRLNGKRKVSPTVVYQHIYRAKEDLQYSLLTLSKRLDNTEENKKRLLVTATYGMHPDGSVLPPLAEGKKPLDVIKMAFVVRKRLNALRTRHSLTPINFPDISEYDKVKPIDIFLQTQFIIAELNLLKIPMQIQSATNSAKPTTEKTPSDVYYQIQQIEYMLIRLLDTL